MNAQRRGTVIILVAGAAALMATLVLAFLVRMRSDGEESNQVVRDTQARIMLLAACGYVLEAGRLGYDVDPQLPDPVPHEEAYGWIDVRDGSTGPRDRDGTALYSS
ncbi:MAG: hypothetical protein H0X45_16655, partial [Planctomycetes bacterium]|nr:hypothetical protein [Planctomycetota bacterium]